MITTKMEISKNDYKEIVQKPRNEIEDFVINVAYNSPFPPCGYGFESPSIFEEDGKYYVSWKRYDSCD